MDKIILSDIKVMATHGVNPEEKQEKQPFNISIICYLDTTQASIDDDISATINYAELYQQIIQEVETTSFNLIEALAGHLAEMILKNYHVKQVKVKVEKSEAKFNGMVFPAAVEIKRSWKSYRKGGLS